MATCAYQRRALGCRRRALLQGLVLVGLAALCAARLRGSEPDLTGPELYATHCARCHGAQGEGVEDAYPDPLHGDRSVDDLALIIDQTMPEDDPQKCTGDGAKRVAEYITATFYSAPSPARTVPPRIAMCRLTVRQYVNAAADLLGGFVGEGKLDGQRGIKGRYFSTRDFQRDKQVFERVDPEIAFDFGAAGPAADKMGNEEFSIQWQGGVLAEGTGEYEFYLQTANAARLWVNGTKQALIDAWVRSGDETEHRASIRLLGGRVYPIQVDYAKFKNETASVALAWKPPGRARQVVPERNLAPGWFPPVLVVKTKFPPDDSSAGYERGSDVSEAWYRATTQAAIEIANAVVDDLETLSKCPATRANRKQGLEEFCYRFAQRAFRRPLSEAERQFFVAAHFDGQNDLETAVKEVVLLVLQSPRFLYLELDDGAVDDYDVATRLSFGLWDSLPDHELLAQAAGGRLRTATEVAQQAARMLANWRTRAKLRYFFHQWLGFDRVADISKDQQRFPGFDHALLSDLQTSLDLFLADTLWGPRSDFRQLFLADHLFLNRRLADYYNFGTLAQDGFQKVPCDATTRAGILTHPWLMANLAYHASTSPIHRGVFVVRSLLGRSLKPPPIAVTPLAESSRPEMTTRQRVAWQTKPANCQTCHGMINPLGFCLEHYDAVGRYRTEELGKPIDASGWYRTSAGDRIELDGARQLAEFLAASPDVHRSFVAQLFHNMVKQPVTAYGSERLEELTTFFVQADYNVQKLLVEIMRRSARQNATDSTEHTSGS